MNHPNRLKLDQANASTFFARELEIIDPESYDEKLQPLQGKVLVPIDESTPAGVEIYTYRRYKGIGKARLISAAANDMPKADVVGSEESIKFYDIGLGADWTYKELQAAQFARRPIDSTRLEKARIGIDTREDEIAFIGLPKKPNTYGLLNFPGVNEYSVPNGVTSGTTFWSGKTPDEIIADVGGMIDEIDDVTNGAANPNNWTLIVPLAQYNLITRLSMGDNTGDTVLRRLETNFKRIEMITWVNKLKGAGAAGTDKMMLYPRNPQTLKQMIQDPMRFHGPVQEGLLKFSAGYTHGVAGVVIFYPLEVVFGDGI